jgi:hypothetical protein
LYQKWKPPKGGVVVLVAREFIRWANGNIIALVHDLVSRSSGSLKSPWGMASLNQRGYISAEMYYFVNVLVQLPTDWFLLKNLFYRYK